LPVSVRLKNHHRSTTTTTVTPRTQSVCGRSAAPKSAIGCSPLKAGSEWIFLSQTSVARPRSRIEAPMVMMMRVTMPAPRAGSTASFSSARPTSVAAPMASSAAAGSGSPASISHTLAMPPIITNSPCAKLMTWLAL
jgi:hypothetical protein